LRTMIGPKPASTSRGNSISTGPISVSAVLVRVPLGEFPPVRDRVVLVIDQVHPPHRPPPLGWGHWFQSRAGGEFWTPCPARWRSQVRWSTPPG
jgi:hypothetical protein